MSSTKDSNAFIVIGLGYGDEGKGSVVDYLARQHKVDLIVRFNGGPQAAHHVVSPEGVTHCFSQFGSGTLVSGVETFLSRFMLVDPLAITVENDVLCGKGVTDALKRLTIDKNCPVVTPFHRIINRMLETSRGEARHGSCGKGVGQAVSDLKRLGERALFVGDLFDRAKTKQKLDFLWRIKTDLAEQIVKEHPDNERSLGYLEEIKRTDYVDILAEAYDNFIREGGVRIVDESRLAGLLARDGNVVFEGAQGVLLDPDKGLKPYVTKTNTTFQNAEKLMAGSSKKIIRIGVLRAYMIRHGAGPFVTEDKWLAQIIPDCHNGENEWQGKFRIGWFDLVATRRAIEIAGYVDGLAMTNIDRLYNLDRTPVCTAYRTSAETCEPIYSREIKGIGNYVRFLERELENPISIISFGPSAKEKIKIKALC